MKDLGSIAEILEGVFYREQHDLFVPGRPESLSKILNGFQGQEVLATIHHNPPDPPDMFHWGVGCCMWEPTGSCPYGHHQDPSKLYHLQLEGTLRQEGPDWYIDTTLVDLAPLEGHRSRLVIVLKEPPAELTDSIMDMDFANANPEELGMRLGRLTEMLSGLSSILAEHKNGDGDV